MAYTPKLWSLREISRECGIPFSRIQQIILEHDLKPAIFDYRTRNNNTQITFPSDGVNELTSSTRFSRWHLKPILEKFLDPALNTLEKAKQEEVIQRTIHHQLRNEILQGKLLYKKDITSHLTTILRSFRERILSIPESIQGEFTESDLSKQVVASVRTQCTDALTQLSDLDYILPTMNENTSKSVR